MAKRGPSISVKMILTTTLLIVVTVVGSGVLNVMNVRRAFDDAARERTNKFRESREILGENVSQLVARAIETPLIQNQDAEILLVIQRAVLLDTRDGRAGKKDYGLRLAYVLDQNQKLVVMCFEDPDLKCIPANEDAAKARTEHEAM